MLASPLPPSFLYRYSLSTSSLGCNALYMVISFLVLWSIFLSPSLVHLRKGPEYLTRGTAQVLIPLMRFLLESFVSSSFCVLLRYSSSYFSLWEFFRPASADGLSLEFEQSSSPQISRTLLSKLADYNSAVVWMVFLFQIFLVFSPILWWLNQVHKLLLVSPLL